MRILGIDPGLRITGFGCIEPDPSPRANRLAQPAVIIEAGVFRLNTKRRAADRLVELDDDFRELLARLKPDAVAVELLFAHYKHPATAILMGHARGVLLLAIRKAAIPLVEVRPTEVKKSLTGHGHAAKAQMQRAIQDEFRLPAPPAPPDIADALAIALCALRRQPA